MPPPRRATTRDPKAFVGRVKRWVASATVAGFAGFSALAATHPVGATTSATQPSAESAPLSTPGAQVPSSVAPPTEVSTSRRTHRTANGGLSNRTSGDATLSTGSS